jgi:tRNA(Arg) A34 adenosine deaminase TadA
MVITINPSVITDYMTIALTLMSCAMCLAPLAIVVLAFRLGQAIRSSF